MAEQASDYHRGEMDIAEHTSTYAAVMAISKWSSLYLAALLLMLVLWFCTSTGFLGGLISGLVLIVLGTLALRKRGGH